MQFTWLSFENFYATYIENDKSTNSKKSLHLKKSKFKTIVYKFFEIYPSPEDWLNNPNKISNIIKYQGYSELHYIACWAWENKLYVNKQYSQHLLEFMLHPIHNRSCIPIWLAEKLGLISQNEKKIIKSIRQTAFKRICVHCLFLMTPLKEFTNEDLYAVPNIFKKEFYTMKCLQDTRVKLGYSNVIIKRNSRKGNWYELTTDPIYGSTYSEYYDFLIRSDARAKYLISTGCALIKLHTFLNENNFNNCSNFTAENFANFTDYLSKTLCDSSTLLYIAKIKKFLSWGSGEDDFFPIQLDFPTEYWTSKLRSIKKARINSDGLAFNEPDIADKIVHMLYNYDPQNETEEMCRSFWLIIASCPTRFSYVLNLGAEGTLQSLPNEPNAFGIYSPLADKAGNKYGQYPILDEIGVSAIYTLQKRVKDLKLKPIINPENGKKYVHLFQLTSSPWILTKDMIRNFFLQKIRSKLFDQYPNLDLLKTSAHGFRHHLLTHIAFITGDIEAVTTAAGHHNEKMTMEYLRSKISRNALLFRVIKKYETKEITGNFYLRLVELLSSEETPADEMMRALTTEMQLDEFLNFYGKKLEMGYCLKRSGCPNWLKCWGCHNFIITKQEIKAAVKTLSHQIINLKEMQSYSINFSYDNPLVVNQVKTISLIVRRLNELNVSDSQITQMVDNFLHNKNIEDGVVI